MIRNEIRQQQQKLKNKSLREKAAYFWYYYKVHVIAAVLGVIVISLFVTSAVRSSREPSVYVALINSRLSSEEDTLLMSGFAQSRDIDVEAHPAVLDYSMRMTPSFSDDVSLASSQQLMVHMNIGDVDVYMCDQWLIDEYASLEAFENLEELLPDSLFVQLKEQLYYVQTEDKGRIPVAFYAGELARVRAEQLYDEDTVPLVAVSRTSKRKDAAVDFIRYLLEDY